MTLYLVAALLTSLAVGSAIASLLCPRTGMRVADALLVLSLGIGSGLGLSSILLFLWLTAANGNGKREPIAVILLAILLAGVAVVRGRLGQRSVARAVTPPCSIPWLTPVFFLAAMGALVAFVLLSLRSPHGEWDAWSHWNRPAVFMFRGGAHWEDAFSSLQAGWITDYPLLTPGAIAHCWFFVGKETLLAPVAVAFMFALSILGLLMSSLFVLRGRSQGMIAGIVLLCSPQFIVQTSSQYADIPLASFLLGAILLLCLHDAVANHAGWQVMAGLMAGLAAWTKNEGLLFALVLVVVRCLVVSASRGVWAWVHEFPPFAVGLLPPIGFVLYFKLRMAGGTNELVEGQTPEAILSHLFSVGRYVTIAKWLAIEVRDFGGWVVSLTLLLLMYLLVAGINHERKDRSAIYIGSITLLLMGCGYILVYILTPLDLVWHLSTSLDRLLMQLWPSVLLTFFLLARSPDEAFRQGSESSP